MNRPGRWTSAELALVHDIVATHPAWTPAQQAAEFNRRNTVTRSISPGAFRRKLEELGLLFSAAELADGVGPGGGLRTC